MKKLSLVLVIIFILIVLLNGYSVRASYEKRRINEIDYGMLQTLLTKRTEIMNKGLYNCDNMDQIIEELKTIEKGDVLESDILFLKETFLNPSDYPFVSNVRIKDIIDVKHTENIYELITTIEWDISYNLEDKTEEYKYILQIEHLNDKYFLEKFRLQE